MFESLSERLGSVFDKLTGRGALSEADVKEAMREVRVALLEADVALPVVKEFVAKATERAVGQEVIKSVKPGQMVVKIVNDALVEMLGGEAAAEAGKLAIDITPPAVIMMIGLQGSGKTTSTAKIARRLQTRERKKVLMASLDVQRPAAQEQLKVLGEQVGVATLPIIPGQMPVDITKRALQAAKLQGFDVLMLDTAGRLHIDAQLMAELASVKTEARPAESLLVVDSLTGQDAVNVARQFSDQVGLSGVVLTRMDGDGRGGAALSMRAVTGQPIKFIGVGEKLDALEEFNPSRVAGRILGMGDVVSLVEKAAEAVEADEVEKLAKKMAAGKFDMDDLRMQFNQMKRIGGLKGVMGLLPGLGKMQKQIDAAGVDDKALNRLEAIILSMTAKERAKPDLINAKRKIRIAKGSGTTVQEVNKLLKMHQDMATAMKKIKKMGGLGALGSLFGGGKKGLGGLPGGMPGGDLPGGALPPGLPGGGLPGGLPGLGGGMPKLPPGWQKFMKK
ncbi:MAG TPA: signal recognition particle protein [Pedomonas sp.]|uniref:signal recognition particle protein n=1 Tax=Pedomonas sp. TaxID=2976421 RepID=UPI002F3F2903